MPKGVYIRTKSVWNKGKRGVHISWNKGKKLSKETKMKLRLINLGKKHSQETKKRMSKSKMGHFVSLEIRKKISEAQKGEKGNNWRGGVYPLNRAIRKLPEYKAWRQRVLERDGFSCVWCGQLRGEIEADHIYPFSYHPELRFDINNGRTLCRKCHSKTPTYGWNLMWKKYY